MIDKNKKSLPFLGLSLEYLALVENVLNETIKCKNKHFVISDRELLPGEYAERTKWSDFMIIIPTLYNFYHGLELVMKGLLLLIEEEISTNHDLEGLFEKIQKNNNVSLEIKNILASHIQKKELYAWILKDFLDENNLSINQMYQAFRYPLDKEFKKIREYYHLHYRESDGIPYFKKIIDDSRKIRKECVSFYRKMEQD